MKKIFLLLCSALLLVPELCAAPAAPAAPKRKRLKPLHEKAEQFRTLERENIKPARLKKLREWFSRKASGKSYTIPETSGNFADKSVAGFRSGDFVFAVDVKTGAPVFLSVKNSANLLDNAVCDYPLWEMETILPGEASPVWTGPYNGSFNYKFMKNGMFLIWKTPLIRVSVTVVKDTDGAALFNIVAKNLDPAAKLNTLDFPKLAFTIPGEIKDVKAVIPWRRGRLRELTEFQHIAFQDYPGSSARFQMTALYNQQSGDGRIFTAVDNEGHEKQFRQIFLPEYKVFLHTLRRFPVDRGKAGNNIEKTFKCKVDVFKGDWYDAALLYRSWWKQQKWAKRGPVYTNDTAEFLKRAPVFLRWYLRQSQNLTADKMEKISNAWTDFLPGRKLPGTLYHYSAFVEPETRKNYPVCEYYGFCADPFPGMVDALKRMSDKGIRASVFLQSEIYNQFDSRTDALTPSLRVDMNGKPRLYVEERYIACRRVPVWRKRYLEMANNLKKMGFVGFYMDTFGKTKINNECFNAAHGHACGGGNIDCEASRILGIDVRKAVHGGDQYIGGEASTEAFVDILDYKLNAVHAYNGMIPLERTLYGDYILSHGRVIRGKYDDEECRSMLMDLVEGVIPGRFFSTPPADGAAREFLKKIIGYGDAGYEYMRTGEMLRCLKFKDNSGIYKFATAKDIHKNVRIPAWRNGVFRSYKDGSIGIITVYSGTVNAKNTIYLNNAAAEWKLSSDARVFRVNEKGERTLIGKLGNIREIELSASPLSIEMFIVTP